jgi:hypothetical protein
LDNWFESFNNKLGEVISPACEIDAWTAPTKRGLTVVYYASSRLFTMLHDKQYNYSSPK